MRRRSAKGSIPLWLLTAACADQPAERSKVAPPYLTSTPSVWTSASTTPSSPATAIAGPALGSATPLTSAAPQSSAERELLGPAFLSEIEARGVTSGRIARRTLYSWTSVAQADAILKGGPVLSREESAKHGPSAFDWMLDDAVGKNDALATLLFHRGFAKKRFAWPNAFATALGFLGETYGSALLAIELAPDALVLDLASRTVTTADGAPSSVAELTAHPERLAAVYWIANPPSPNLPPRGPAFREYVLVNEATIRKVTVGGPTLTALLDDERKLVARVNERVKALPEGREEATLTAFAALLSFNMGPQRQDVETMNGALAGVRLATPTGERAIKASFALGLPRARLKASCKMSQTRGYSYRSTVCLPADRCALVGGTCVGGRHTGFALDL